MTKITRIGMRFTYIQESGGLRFDERGLGEVMTLHDAATEIISVVCNETLFLRLDHAAPICQRPCTQSYAQK